MKTVLIVTHQRGFESDPVIDQIRSRGIKVFRFNTDQGEYASRASFGSGSESMEFECDGRRILSEEIGIGWCQQLPPYLDQPSNETECLQNQNLWALHSTMFELLVTPWLNKPSCVCRASNKVLQIALARELGLSVPDTLISNQPDRVRAFAEHHSIVAKNLATPWIIRNEGTRVAYTRIVAEDWLTSDASSFCPVIYQRYHERRRDYRVVVIGERVFTACCEPNEHQREDIREGVGTGESFVVCDFDKSALKKLMSLMRALSLEYCAADFIEDTEGNLYFLEVNTCGAWWWLDRLYNGAICKAITDFLVHIN